MGNVGNEGLNHQESAKSSPIYCISIGPDIKPDKKILGSKGAGLVEMTRMGLPVPPAFVITTDLFRDYQRNGSIFEDAWWQIEAQLRELEHRTGMWLGDGWEPLLVSVRSGAPVSMPGIMETILNVGITDDTLPALAVLIGEEAAVEAARNLRPLPKRPRDQVREAIIQVFDSWNSQKAVEYRKAHGIDNNMGTAVVVQQMVWGNSMKDGAGTGVLLTRDTQQYGNQPVVAFAPHRQGIAVVSPDSVEFEQAPLAELTELPEHVRAELLEYAQRLEAHYGHVPQDVEFTYDGGKLWILQTRDAPLGPLANLRSLQERISGGFLTEHEALRQISVAHLATLLTDPLDPQALETAELLGQGISVSYGNKSGRLVFTPEEAEALQEYGERIILVAGGQLTTFVQLSNNVDAVLLEKAGIGSHLVREGTGMTGEREIILVCGISIDTAFEDHGVTVDGNTGRVYRGYVPRAVYKFGDGVLTPQEYEVAHRWLVQKTENPWRFLTKGARQEMYRSNIEEALRQAESTGTRSLRAKEIIGFNEAIPRVMRQHYTVVPIEVNEPVESLRATIQSILADIFCCKNDATIRTCHEPILKASAPWALVKNMKDFQDFLINDHYSKYGGFPQFIRPPDPHVLSELLIGDIPVGKMDPDLASQHCTWTLSCTKTGEIILQVVPHNAQLRSHETATSADFIVYTTRVDVHTGELMPVARVVGDKVGDELSLELAEMARGAVFDTWWHEQELPARLAALSIFFGTNVTLEGQGRISEISTWCLGYGIKTDT